METTIAMPTLDAEGYLVEPGEWNEEVAKDLAQRSAIKLSADHWDVIRFMRAYQAEHQISAAPRLVVRHLEKRYPGDGRKRLFDLFPYGYVAQACKIAGMKRPRGWSTG